MREIGRRLRVSLSVVHRLQERFEATGSTDARPCSGRPRCTNRGDDQFLHRTALRDRTISSVELSRRLTNARGVNVSSRTVRNRLNEDRLYSRRPAVRTLLTAAHRRARVAWCRRHSRWTRQQWSRVLFSDESRFTMSLRDNRRRVWRRQGERYLDEAVQEVVRFGGGSVMAWGAFHLHGRTPLLIICGSLTGLRYREEILRPLVEPALQAIGPGAILQDDNATPHRARIATQYEEQRGIQRMEWPANSPDLAPIEHLWDALGRRVRENYPPPATIEELSHRLQVEWENIPQVFLRRLVNSMRRHYLETLAANDGYTRH